MKHIQNSWFYLWKQKAHGLRKNLVCEQSVSKGSGEENKTNAFITLIKEQRHRDFSLVNSSSHWQFHKWKSFPQNRVYCMNCFVAKAHCKPGRYFHDASFHTSNFIHHMCMAHGLQSLTGRNPSATIIVDWAPQF